MDKDTLRFIDKLYKDLYKSEQVLHHSNGSETDKFNNLNEYFDTLKRVHEKASKSEERTKTLKRLYFNKYVIKREDIPDSYYESQKRIALERGFGHVEINSDMKNQLQDEVIENQKNSLDTWISYFLSGDSKFYPFWLKYWAFQGMLKLGTYDKENGTFNKRTTGTTSPFADLNMEALSKSMDLVLKMLKKEKIDDRELEIIVKTGSFQKIYPYILKNVFSDNSKIIKKNEGIWIKYNKGSDHIPLVKSLQGYNTGWCTAGESTAKSQLSNGDFYVYYTLDENGKYKVPRIAIRMDDNHIGEIRGVAREQNIESDMEKVLEEKLKEFPDRNMYYKKVEDMKKLTELYKKYKENTEFTKEELRFLFEIDSKIIGFGYGKDPRINEIIKFRNIKKDLSKIFNCTESQISLKREEITEDSLYYFGNLYLADITPEGLILPLNILGDLDLGRLETAKGLKLPKSIRGDLELDRLESAEGLILPERIGGNLCLKTLKSSEGLTLPKKVEGDLELDNLRSAKGLTLPETVGGNLYLTDLKTAKGLTLPERVGGDLNICNLETSEGLTLPESIGKDLVLSRLREIKGLTFPKSIGGSIYFNTLKTAKELRLPESIGKSLFLSSLQTAKDLTLPESIGGDLFLGDLETAEGLTLPKTIGGYLYLTDLKTAKGLTLPERVGGGLYLSSLETAEGLNLPENVGGDIDLSNLKSTEGLLLPQNFKNSVILKDFTISQEDLNKFKKNNKNKRKIG